MPHFEFLTDYKGKVSRLADFWQLAQHNIPETPGVYLLVAESVHFRYPASESPIYYIGHTQSLRRRLFGHLKWHKQVRDDCRQGYSLSEPRHEYGGVYGGRYCFIKTWRGRSARSLEDIVLARFACKYHAFPVANSAGAWKRIEREFL